MRYIKNIDEFNLIYLFNCLQKTFIRQFHKTSIDVCYSHWWSPGSVLLPDLHQHEQKVIQLATMKDILRSKLMLVLMIWVVNSFYSYLLLSVGSNSGQSSVVQFNMFPFVIIILFPPQVVAFYLLSLQQKNCWEYFKSCHPSATEI